MTTVCLAANCLDYPTGGGHLWAYLNWALGFRSLGCDVVWLEGHFGDPEDAGVQDNIARLKLNLEPFGLERCVVTYGRGAHATADIDKERISSLRADLLLNLSYDMPEELVALFPKSAMLDIDPGLTQRWMAEGMLSVASHDFYFTIGETVGTAEAPIHDVGLPWIYTRPAVSLDAWGPGHLPKAGAFTTVTQWYAGEWIGGPEGYSNDKREGFLPYLDLPHLVDVPLELAVNVGEIERFREEIAAGGWRMRDAETELSTPVDYRRYIQSSLGEFSCAKPSCVRTRNAWVSDRTLCYLASGKPAVVQHTGPSRFLPDRKGMLRFRDVGEAIACIHSTIEEYETHSTAARELAETYFDASTICSAMLERTQ